jgi:hypothetical protein
MQERREYTINSDGRPACGDPPHLPRHKTKRVTKYMSNLDRLSEMANAGPGGGGDFLKIWEPPQNSGHQMGAMKEAAYRGPANWRHSTIFSRHSGLAPDICAPLA